MGVPDRLIPAHVLLPGLLDAPSLLLDAPAESSVVGGRRRGRGNEVVARFIDDLSGGLGVALGEEGK